MCCTSGKWLHFKETGSPYNGRQHLIFSLHFNCLDIIQIMLNIFHFEIDAEVWPTKDLSVRHKYDNVIRGASSSSQIILKQYLRPGMIKKKKKMLEWIENTWHSQRGKWHQIIVGLNGSKLFLNKSLFANPLYDNLCSETLHNMHKWKNTLTYLNILAYKKIKTWYHWINEQVLRQPVVQGTG